MKIDFYCVGMCRDDGEPTQIAGCGIVIVFTDDHNRVKFRSFQYGLGNSSQNLADLQAIRLALSSVTSMFRSGRADVHTDSPYAAQMLERDGKAFVVDSDVNEVIEARRWYGYYGDITVVVEDPQDDSMVQARDLAEIALATQEHSDSGTLDGFDASG